MAFEPFSGAKGSFAVSTTNYWLPLLYKSPVAERQALARSFSG